MSDVFISYASSSRVVAGWIAAGVEKLGFSVWWDSELLPHDQYGQMIERQLEAAKCVIVLWSDDARQSRWVLSDANRALGEGKLIQGNLSDRLPPLPFDQIQVVRLDEWGGEGDHPSWLRIAASVRQLAGGVQLGQTSLIGPDLYLPRTPDRAWPKYFGLLASGVLALAILPLVAGRYLLSAAQSFLATPLTALAVGIVMVALLLFLPERAARLRAGLIVAALAGSLAAVVAQAMLADRFIVSGEWTEGPLLLGCGVPPPTCVALRQDGFICENPHAMCPLAGRDQAETVLMNYGYDPVELYGPLGMGRVKRWMQLAWNGLFLSLAVLGSALMTPFLKAQRRK